MLALKVIREEADRVRAGIDAKGEVVDLERVLELEREHRGLVHEIDELRAEKNRASQVIAAVKRSGGSDQAAIATMRTVSRQIKELEERAAGLQEELLQKAWEIPNLPHASVPVGVDARGNVTVREWGQAPQVNFELQDHLELGRRLNLFDFQRGAKIAGSGFPLYTGQGARLERALINFMLDFHVERYGYTEVFPPFLTHSAAAMTTGQLPKFGDDMYRTEQDDFWLIPTAEVPVTNIHRDEILEESQLPLYYSAYSACFRREAGSYGKETRGYLRVHQFNKVELVKFVRPETSYDELESLTTQAEAVLQALGLRYRVVMLCSGDLSFAAAKCYDLEVWAPGEGAWLEVSSCSNYESFQARRGNIRYRRSDNRKVDFLHTLNGSGLATPRLLVALLETYQTAESTVVLPEILHPYMGKGVLE